IETTRIAFSSFMNFPSPFCRRIFSIALGVAHWLMREATLRRVRNSIKLVRRGMAEDMDVAQPADSSVLARLPMRNEDGELRHEFIEEITRAIHAAETSFLRE